ncbi:hypothetical protein [Sphingobium herbicidovorans]
MDVIARLHDLLLAYPYIPFWVKAGHAIYVQSSGAVAGSGPNILPFGGLLRANPKVLR